MNKEEFIQKVIDEFEDYLPRGFQEEIEITRCSVVKANDQKHEGIIVKRTGSNVAPNFYLEEMFEAYEEGQAFDVLMYRLIASYMEALKIAPPEAKLDRSRIEKGVCGLKLLYKKRNKTYLKDNAWKDFCCGLVMTADYLVEDEETGEWRIKVAKEMLRRTGLSVEEFFSDIIWSNSINFPAVLMPVNDSTNPVNHDINLLDGDFEVDECPMYILTTKRQNFGAVAMVYPGVLEEVAHIVGGDFFVIPSSVHEVMIMPISDGLRPDLLQDAVRDANSNMLSADDVLSDDLMYYNRSRGKLILYDKMK